MATNVTFHHDANGALVRRVRGDGIDFTLSAWAYTRVLDRRQRARETGSTYRITTATPRPHQLRVSASHVGIMDCQSGRTTVLNLGALACPKRERQMA